MPMSHYGRFVRSCLRMPAMARTVVLGMGLALLTPSFLLPGAVLAQTNPNLVEQRQTAPGTCTPTPVAVPQNCITQLMMTTNPTLGNILTDGRGNTLYYYDDPTSSAAKD